MTSPDRRFVVHGRSIGGFGGDRTKVAAGGYWPNWQVQGRSSELVIMIN